MTATEDRGGVAPSETPLADALYAADPNRCHEDARMFDSYELKILELAAAANALAEQDEDLARIVGSCCCTCGKHKNTVKPEDRPRQGEEAK